MNLFNPNPFRRTLDTMKDRMLELPADERSTGLTMLAIASHVPLIAVVGYALRADVLGELPELRRQQTSNLKFYHYDGIEQWEDLLTK